MPPTNKSRMGSHGRERGGRKGRGRGGRPRGTLDEPSESAAIDVADKTEAASASEEGVLYLIDIYVYLRYQRFVAQKIATAVRSQMQVA
jgi:hypothetical protein